MWKTKKVRLPALINQMPLTKCRRSIVLRHLYLFIAYLDATRDFWFTATRPSLAAPILCSSSVSTSISIDAAATPCGVKRTELRSRPFTINASTTEATPPTASSIPRKRRRFMSSEPESKTVISPPSSPPPSLSSATSSELSFGWLVPCKGNIRLATHYPLVFQYHTIETLD
ncbi:hypothetical protein TSMEX_003866 [Taenia solium]|eukprot:TsM_001129900 transcript=TsM_001129900 gene=TsM_001129900